MVKHDEMNTLYSLIHVNSCRSSSHTVLTFIISQKWKPRSLDAIERQWNTFSFGQHSAKLL